VPTSPLPLTVLVVGATGSIGRLVLEQAVAAGHRVRALVRDQSRAAGLPEGAAPVVGDLTDAATLVPAVAGVDAVVLTHGSHGGDQAARAVDYGAVRNTLRALDGATARIALMTTIGVTKHSVGHDWKRRGERLVRASGLPYTIVRPGWFDAGDPDQRALTMLQGDRRWAGDPSDGVIARDQIAQVLLASLTSPAAEGKTLDGDFDGDLDGVWDTANMPVEDEPAEVTGELGRVRGISR
jgi:uncharacterized protein YbjT (DUF2867 family)